MTAVDDYTKSREHKEIEKLAETLASVLQTEGIQARVAQVQEAMLEDIRQVLFETAMKAFLAYRSTVIDANDVEWARIMASGWLTNEDSYIPTNPHALKALIVSLQHERELTLARVKQSDGYQEGWRTAYVSGVRFGWGASNMGKGLQETEAAASKVPPHIPAD